MAVDYHNEAGLPPTIPPPAWIHNVTCYTPLLLKDELALENSVPGLGSLVKSLLIVTSALATILFNSLFLTILNKKSYYRRWIRAQPRIIFSALAINDLLNGLLVLGIGICPAILQCWPFGETLCQLQALLRGTFTQQASLTLIVMAVERYLAAVHPLTFEGFCSLKTCVLSLLSCLFFSATLYALIVIPPGGFHFNINGLLVCEPYFISNNVLALAACLFYFPTTMILMYCYGTIFHSAKVKTRYKKAVLTSLPFVDGRQQASVAEQILVDKRISDGTSHSSAAVSLLFIIVVTPWAVQQVITSCTRTIAPPTVDFLVSWLANSHRFLSPIIYWILNEHFRLELHSYCAAKLRFRTQSKTWLVTQGQSLESQEAAGENWPKVDTPTQEQHWGEILERTVSKQNLSLLVNGTNGTILNQTFPRRNSRLVAPANYSSRAEATSNFMPTDFSKSTLSLEMNSSGTTAKNSSSSSAMNAGRHCCH